MSDATPTENDLENLPHTPFPSELRSDKPLSPEDTELLQQQWDAFNALRTQPIFENPLRRRVADGKPELAKGTLIHGVRFNLETLQKIKDSGILSGDFTGQMEDGETFYCADFFMTTKDTSVGQYVEEYSKPRVIGGLTTTMGEPTYLPTPKPRSDRIGFLIDTSDPRLQTLLRYDAYDPASSERMGSIVNRLPRQIDPNQPRNISAVLVGVPSNFISGVIVGGGITSEQQAQVQQIMGPMVNVYSPQGVQIPST